jgi:hypothetical protein
MNLRGFFLLDSSSGMILVLRDVDSIGSGANFRFDFVLVSTGCGANFRTGLGKFSLHLGERGDPDCFGAASLDDFREVSIGSGLNRLGGEEEDMTTGDYWIRMAEGLLFA